MNGWYSDLRSGFRILTRSPGPASLAVLVLALGIGLTAAMFSIVYGVVLRGLPIERAEQLMHLEVAQGGQRQQVSTSQFLEWSEHQDSFSELHGFHFESVYLSGEGYPERVEGARMTPGAFSHLGILPQLGRDFSPHDAMAGAEPVALIGHRLWRDRFASNPQVVGRTLRLNGLPTTVIGVMPEGFQFPNRQEIWQPVTLVRVQLPGPQESSHNLHVFGRLADSKPPEQAAVDLGGVHRRWAEQHAEPTGGLSVEVVPYGRYFIGDEEVNLSWTSLGAVSFVLLIACFNVANLLLARASGRARELAMRSVLGAGRWRMIRQGLGESLVLSAVATVVGIGLGSSLIWVFNQAVVDQEWPFWLDIRLDQQALIFVILCAFFAAAISGLLPAWRSSRLDINKLLKDESKGSRGSRLSSTLVIGEVALSCTLLVASVLMVRTLINLGSEDLAFQTDQVYVGRVTLLSTHYPNQEQLSHAWLQLEEQLQALPQVSAASVTDKVPAAEWAPRQRYAVDGNVYDQAQSQPVARRVRVSAGFFDALGVEPVVGRGIESSDLAASQPVVVVNDSLAQLHWPDGQAVGKTLRMNGPDSKLPWRTVVGVVPDLHAGGPRDQGPGAIYLPMQQELTRSAALLLRTRVPVAEATLSIRETVASFDPDLAVYFGGPLTKKIYDQFFFYRMVGTVFSLMALTAILLAATGLYALSSFGVTQRISELGVRLALGASSGEILKLVIKLGLKQVGWGLALGLCLAAGLARLLEHQLFGISPFDPITFATVAMILLLTGSLAALVPALRASRIDPVEALRRD